jgi:DNA-binding NarL/FixJ family response regulator
LIPVIALDIKERLIEEKSQMAPYDIVLANHHAPLRECLKRILTEGTDLRVIGEAGDTSELLDLLDLGDVSPHLVILDLALPNLTGDVIHRLKAIRLDIKVLVLSMHKDKEYLGRAILNGAEGYLLKENAGRELLKAIETIRNGGLYLPSGFSGGGNPVQEPP